MGRPKKKTTDIDINRGKRLATCRKDKGYTLEELAKKVHATPQAIQNYEKGIRTIPLDYLLDIAKVLHVNPAYIMCEEDSKYGSLPYESIFVNPTPKAVEFIKYLCFSGVDISFHIEQRFPIGLGKVHFEDGERIFHCMSDVSIDCLKNFSLYTPYCTYKDNSSSFEAVIDSVHMNNRNIDFDIFALYIKQMMYQVDYMAAFIESFADEYRDSEFIAQKYRSWQRNKSDIPQSGLSQNDFLTKNIDGRSGFVYGDKEQETSIDEYYEWLCSEYEKKHKQSDT